MSNFVAEILMVNRTKSDLENISNCG